MDLLAKQQAHLKRIDASMDSLSQEARKLKQQVRELNQKKRYQKLTRAGLIFEEAGILDDYDHDTVLKVLQKMRKSKEGENGG